MRFSFTVVVEVERMQGKFASRDEVAEQIATTLESANPDSIDGVGADGSTEYSVVEWEITEDV